MDIKAKIAELVEKIQNDKELLEKFRTAPIPTVESLLGVDLPDDTIEKIVEGVKAKINLDDITDKLGGLAGLFGKK